MSNIFKCNVRRALNQQALDSSQGIFGGDSNVIKNLDELKKMSTLLKSVLLQTKKSGKAGKKSGAKKAKQATAGGSKGKNKKGSKKKPKKGAKKSSDDSKDMEDSKEKDKKSDDPCKLVTHESATISHPSSHGLCGCGASMDNNVSSIPRSADWPVSFPL